MYRNEDRRALFHRDVFFPKGTDEKVRKAQEAFDGYVVSRHLSDHIGNREDRSHDYKSEAIYDCIDSLRTTRYDAFEVEYGKGFYEFGTDDWVVTKYCVRIPYSQNQDIVVVVMPKWNKFTRSYEKNGNFIKTAWLNHMNDDHKTLDFSKYKDKDFWEGCGW